MEKRAKVPYALLVAAAAIESILWRFPPLLDIGPQPGDPVWYTLHLGTHAFTGFIATSNFTALVVAYRLL